MVIVVVCLVIALIFLFTFIKQLFNACCLFFEKEKIISNTEPKHQKKLFQVVKQKRVLHRKKLKNNLCSVKIFAKFLNEKAYIQVPIARKILISKIYERVVSNVIQFNANVDFGKLSNAGFNSCVFLLKKPKEQRKFSNLLFALNVLKQKVCFLPIFVSETESEKVEGYKNIFLQDFNLKLFEDVCKINLNYDPLFNKKLELPFEDFSCEKEIQVKRIASENNLISYCFNSKINTSVFVFIKLDSFLFNLKKENNSFEITYFNNKKIRYFSNNKILEINSINYNFIPYLCVKIKLNKNLDCLLLCDKEPIFYKNLLLEEKMFFENFFNIKIYTKDQKFNNFFNFILKNQVKKELYEKNYFKKSNFIFNKRFISNFLREDYADIAKIKTGTLLYNHIVENSLGIEIKNGFLKVKKKCEFDFKLIIYVDGEYKSIFVQNEGEKQVKIGETVFLSCNQINLNLLSKPATLCV